MQKNLAIQVVDKKPNHKECLILNENFKFWFENVLISSSHYFYNKYIAKSINWCTIDQYALVTQLLDLFNFSHDIMSRWAYPLVPDNNISNHDNKVSYGRHNVYLSKDVTLAR